MPAVGLIDVGGAIRRTMLPKVNALFAPECPGDTSSGETFEEWFAREYESVNGYVSTGDPTMWQQMQHAKGWARRVWERRNAGLLAGQ